MSDEESTPKSRPSLETLIGRALRLRCPRCGEGKLFSGWFTMPERCSECRLKYERASGYFLGAAYINYGVTALLVSAAYFFLHFGLHFSNRQLAAPLAGFCIVVPLMLFRFARAVWLAMDCHIDQSVLVSED